VVPSVDVTVPSGDVIVVITQSVVATVPSG
jgi:hypothetical protein